MKAFPVGTYGRGTLHFHPAPYQAPLRAFAALVFAWQMDGEGERILICDIVDRGWCIPSGRVEAGESSKETVIREAQEEAGAELRGVQYIGCYRMVDRGETRWADVFAAEVGALGAIGIPEESLGCQLVEPSRLPEIYYLWNELTERMFEHSAEIVRRAISQRTLRTPSA